MLTFYRGTYSEAVIEIHSSEELGVLDTGYIESAHGLDGSISVRNVATGDRTDLLMAEINDGPPAHDFFRGYLNLTGLPNGQYALDFKVRDLFGNVTVVGQVDDPAGAAAHQDLDLWILSKGTAKMLVRLPPRERAIMGHARGSIQARVAAPQVTARVLSRRLEVR